MAGENILDVFHDDAFGMIELTRSINVVPNAYGRLQELNLFPGQGVATVTVSIEFENGVLNLLPSRPRGSPSTVGRDSKRNLRSFTIPHIPHDDVVKASDVQGVRAFGSGSRFEAVQTVVNRKLLTMRRKHAITLEYLRVGAMKGQILDADGSLIYNLFNEFGIAEKVVDFDFGGTPNVEHSCREVTRWMEDNLLGDVMTGVHGLVSPEFFDSLTADAQVRDSYKYWQSQANLLQKDPRKGFTHQGITFEEYRGTASYVNPDGSVTNRRFIPAGEARFFPEGTNESFGTYFAPADFIETVNTEGMEVYAKQAIEKFGRWVDIHTQSNPLPLCMRPALLVRGTST